MIGALVETDLEVEVEADGRLNWTVACGRILVGAPSPPTLDVSFFAKGGIGAGPEATEERGEGPEARPPEATGAGVGAMGATVADGRTGA